MFVLIMAGLPQRFNYLLFTLTSKQPSPLHDFQKNPKFVIRLKLGSLCRLQLYFPCCSSVLDSRLFKKLARVPPTCLDHHVNHGLLNAKMLRSVLIKLASPWPLITGARHPTPRPCARPQATPHGPRPHPLTSLAGQILRHALCFALPPLLLHSGFCLDRPARLSLMPHGCVHRCRHAGHRHGACRVIPLRRVLRGDDFSWSATVRPCDKSQW